MLQARSTAIASRPAPTLRDRPAEKEIPRVERRPLGLKGVLLILLAGCFLFSLVIIAQYSSMVALHYRLGQAESRIKTLQSEYRQLEQEAAQLSSLARIEVIARSELGMQEPESGQVRVLTACRESVSTVGE